jgi:hypothetical protein
MRSSTITLGVARPFAPEPTSGPGNVLILAAEDSAEHTLKPRLHAAGADLTRCLISECIAIGDHERPIRLTAAADVLAGLLGSDDERVRHASAVKILELGTKLRESVAIEERVAELERRLAEGAGGER